MTGSHEVRGSIPLGSTNQKLTGTWGDRPRVDGVPTWRIGLALLCNVDIGIINEGKSRRQLKVQTCDDTHRSR